MAVAIKCPSCGSDKVSMLSSIKSEDIVTQYKRNGIYPESQFKDTPSISYIHCGNCDLKFFKPAIAGDEDFYNQLQNMEWYFAHPDKTEFTYAKEFVKKNDKVLDVGSGRGVWSQYLKDIEGVYYQGIEFSSKSIELAQKDGVNVIKESVELHAQKLPAYYDVVVAFQVLEHIDKIQEFMLACAACVKPGGKLIIAVPNNDGFLSNMINNWLNVPPHHINHWNETSLRKLGQQLNLKTAAVYKEKVTNVHKLLYYSVSVYSKLNKLMSPKRKLIDNSFKFRVVNKLSVWTGKVLMSVSNSHKTKDGHTIAIVYEK